MFSKFQPLTLITFILAAAFFSPLMADDPDSKQSDLPEFQSTYQMEAGGYPFSSIECVRKTTIKDGKKVSVENANGIAYIPNEDGTTSNSTSEETVSFNEQHILSYKGKFTENDQTTTMEAHVNDGKLYLMGRMSENDLALTQDFELTGFDFTTAYVTPNFFKDADKKKVTKNIFNFYGPEIRPNNLEFLGKETVEMVGQTFECEKVTFDYEIIKGTMWIAKDDVGYFLVKEEAESAEYGPFQMKLTSYNKAGEGEETPAQQTDFDF